MGKNDTGLPYQEGTWFAVPLRTNGFGVGIIARMKADEKGGIDVGYFFGRRFATTPSLNVVDELRPQDALLVCRFGDLGLVDRSWPILGKSSNWSKERWPMPAFVRTNPLNGRLTKVTYSEADIQKVISDVPTTPIESQSTPRDGLFGAGAVEIVLTKAIESQEKSSGAGLA